MSRPMEYKRSDFIDAVPPRVFGSETEFSTDRGAEDIFQYTMTVRDADIPLLYDYVDKRHAVTIGRSVMQSIITSNGGEIYMDMDVLEYATPECESPKQLTIQERAGEEMILLIVDKLNQDRDRLSQASLTRRSGYAHVYFDDAAMMIEMSAGHHENYLSHTTLIDTESTSLKAEEVSMAMRANPQTVRLSTFLTLRKLIDGVGMVDEFGYSITQKPRAFDFYHFTSPLTHGRKKAFQRKGDRLEIRSGEGSKSDWATEFKYGLTSAVLRLVEHNVYPKHIVLHNCNHAIQDIAYDPLTTVKLKSGLDIRAIDALKQIVDHAADLISQYDDAPKYEIKAINDFYQFYEDIQNVSLEDNDASALADRIDWAARYQYLLRRGHDYESLNTYTNLAAVRDDLKWDLLGDRDIARKYYRKFGHTALRGNPDVMPPNTRAKGRIEIARHLTGIEKDKDVSWDYVTAKNDQSYSLPNPYGVDPELIEHIKESYRA